MTEFSFAIDLGDATERTPVSRRTKPAVDRSVSSVEFVDALHEQLTFGQTVTAMIRDRTARPALGLVALMLGFAAVELVYSSRANSLCLLASAGAQAEMSAIMSRLEKQYPEANTDSGVLISPIFRTTASSRTSSVLP